MKLSKLIAITLMLFVSHAFAEVYRWVDEEGVTQYSDCPPMDCVYEELELPEGPSDEEIKAAEKQAREILEDRKAREAAARTKKDNDTLEEHENEQLRVERLKKCTEAIYQLGLLDQKRRVFRIEPDGSRLYLEDDKRSDEIARITAVKDQFCSAEQGDQREQLESAHRMSLALSRRCTAARDTLEKMQQPGANTIEDKFESYQAFVDAFCPDIESDNLWLGDWIIVRKRR